MGRTRSRFLRASTAIAAGGNQGQGGLSLFQDVPSEGTWANPATSGLVTVTTSASAAQNISITQVSPTAGVSLSWTDMGLDELWYEVQRSTNGTTWSTIGTTPMNVGTTFTRHGDRDQRLQQPDDQLLPASRPRPS